MEGCFCKILNLHLTSDTSDERVLSEFPAAYGMTEAPKIGELPADNLVSFFTAVLRFPYHFCVLQFKEHGIHGCFIGCAKVLQKLGAGLDIVWSLSEVGDEIKDVNLFHGFQILMLIRIEFKNGLSQSRSEFTGETSDRMDNFPNLAQVEIHP